MVELSRLPMPLAAGRAALAGPRSPGVLIADDVGLILTLLKFELAPHGFDVWLAVDGDDAIALYRRHADEIDVVLLDVQMPGLDGPATMRALKQLNPDVTVCFMTGHFSDYSEADLLAMGAARVFRKPFRPREVVQFLNELCGTEDE